MMASRTNLILSLPMLYCMIMGAHRGRCRSNVAGGTKSGAVTI